MNLRSTGGNPLIPGIGMSDPHIRVFEDRLYLFSGHDHGPEDRDWVMPDWRIFSSTDLVHWEHEHTIRPAGTYMEDHPRDCWAGDAAQRNGRTYFYFSNRNRDIGVMAADHPAGPFRDALGEPLVRHHDPTIFIDDNPALTPYLVFGSKEVDYHIACLNDDMVSLAEKPKPLHVRGEGWEKAPHWMDKNFLFKRHGLYYLSWGSDYATSPTVYGPYAWQGRVGAGYGLGPFAHGSFFEWQGQFYHVWCRYLKDGYKFRESLMTYCHLGEDGVPADDTRFLDRHFACGVGRYEAAWGRIEAEWFTGASPGLAKRRTAPDNWEVTGLREGSWLKFANVDFHPGFSRMTLSGHSDDPDAAVELRVNRGDGHCLCRLPLRDRFAGASFPPVLETHDIFLVWRGHEGASGSLDWIAFQP